MKELITNWIRSVLQLVIKQKIDEVLKTEETKQPIPDVTIKDTKQEISTEDPSKILSSEILSEYDFDGIARPEVIDKGKEKTILVVDDVIYTNILYQSDFKKIKEKYNKDIEEDFNIVKCLGSTAGYSAYRYTIVEGHKVDIAIIDITLGYRVNIANKYYVEIDGIDLAYHLVQKYPDIKFIMCTAHTLNLNNSVVKRYYNKMGIYLNYNLEDKYLNKNDDRVEKLYELIYGG